MAAQLKINTATSPVSLKEMSGTDYDYTTYQILNTFASTDTGVGTVSINPAVTTGLTSIGTFSDTFYNEGSPGTHPVAGTLTTNNYVFYQDLQTATETLTRPIEYSSGLKEQTDTTLNADSITVALANLVANGIGAYALSTTAPAGGTWTSKYTIINYNYTGSSTSTYLWRKTAGASVPSALRPLKLNSTSPVSTKEMSDAEIQTLTDRFRNRIVASGIGKYQLASTSPVSGGTWVSQGSVTDTRNTESLQPYSGTYSGSYSGNYTGSFTGVYTGSFTGVYTGSFTGVYTQGFTGAYTGIYSRVFTGIYTLYYAGFIGGNFTGNYTGSFTGIYSGTYTGSFTGVYSQGFTGVYNQAFTGIYSRVFTGSYTGAYTGSYTGLTIDAGTTTVSTMTLWLRTA